jgi:hypothetical protein
VRYKTAFGLTMKYILILFFLTMILSSCAQEETKTYKNLREETPIKYEARRDSILVQTNYGSIYFTRDTTAKSYGYLNPIEIDSSVFRTVMPEMIQSIQEKQKLPVKHFDHELINSSWSSLYWFNSAFCLYSPSDWMSNTPVLLTDSILYYLASDPGLEILKSFKKINSHKFEFTSLDFTGNFKTTTIEIIDPKKGIAIWEYRYANNDSVVRELKVRSENVKLFPMLIFDCGENKCVFDQEDFFDEPDFSELRKKSGNVK